MRERSLHVAAAANIISLASRQLRFCDFRWILHFLIFLACHICAYIYILFNCTYICMICICFTLVRWLPHPTRKSLVSRRSTSAIFPHRQSLAFCCSQAVKNQTQALASFSRKQWGMWSLRTVLRPGCCELARSCNLHQPTHSNYNTYNTQHVWNKTRRKSSGGSGGGEDFCYKTTPSSSGSMAVWSSNSPLCAKCMRCSFHMFPLCYALAWNFGRRSDMTRKTLVREMSTVFFALWGLSRLRVRDDSLCDLADCFCISMEICLLVDPEDACWETNWCEIEHVFSFLSFSLYLSLSRFISLCFSLSLDSRNSAGWVHQWQWDLYSAAWRSAGRPCWADSSQHSQMWHVWHVTCCILLWTPSDVPHPKVSKLSKPVLALFNYHTSCGRQMWPSSEWKVTIDRNKPHPPKAIPLHLGWSLCVVSCRIFWTCDENPRMPGWSYGWKRWPRPFGVQDPGQLSYTATQNHVVFLCFSYEQIIYHIP